VRRVWDGVLTFDYNDFHRHTRLTADGPLSPGAREIVLQVTRTAEGGGEASLQVDGRTVAAGAWMVFWGRQVLRQDEGRRPAASQGEEFQPGKCPWRNSEWRRASRASE